ncbi:MAG: chromate efflux transporter [Rhodospirillaceae bacterium]
MSGEAQGQLPTVGADGRPWPTLREALVVWARVALLSFGGPAGQIAVMHRIVVVEKKWLGEERFLHALNFCMLLPGPEAQQLTVYIGWLMHRWLGGLIAGILFVLPGAIAVLILSYIYALYGKVDFVSAAFFGLKAAVLAIVLQAVVRIGSKALRNAAMTSLAALSFIAIFAFAAPFPAIILAAGAIGYFAGRAGHPAFVGGGGHGSAAKGKIVQAGETILGEGVPHHARPENARVVNIAVLLSVLWLAPVIALLALLGPDNVFADISLFFSKMAVVTFGGAYAVLAYVAQAAVDTYGWLAPGEMLDGLGLAETTPGPLIMVTQFVGFMGAFRDPGTLSPLAAGTLGAALTTWVTFAPCFLWIFLGAPYVERLRGSEALSAALGAITAAVVGVILNLAVWFALHVVFDKVETFEKFGLHLAVPDPASIDVYALVLVAAAIFSQFRLKISMMWLLAAAAAIGLGLHFAGLFGV